jgi:hypothetical protein
MLASSPSQFHSVASKLIKSLASPEKTAKRSLVKTMTPLAGQAEMGTFGLHICCYLMSERGHNHIILVLLIIATLIVFMISWFISLDGFYFGFMHT